MSFTFSVCFVSFVRQIDIEIGLQDKGIWVINKGKVTSLF